MNLVEIKKPGKDVEDRVGLRCNNQGGPVVDKVRAICHRLEGHKIGKHQCVTMAGTTDEKWWEWD